jgi:hypothetical protein
MKEKQNYQLEVGFVEQDTALESMRASDFDCYSAYGEIIDNSIQAHATDIRIEFQERVDRNARSKRIGRVLFADNGIGMEKSVLHTCLKLGKSSRYNDRDGIGRFGVGMTLGAIHECRHVDVYSKVKDGIWHYTYLDLDEIKNGTLASIPVPVQKEPEFEISNYIEDSGTLVIWSKYDKQIEPYETVVEESKIWLGRTFRKFLWGEAKGYKEVDIIINSKKIKAIDPLYFNKYKTGFENEDIAKLDKATSLDWLIPKEVDAKKQKSNILIKTSLLPDTYRRERYMGKDQFAKERFIDRNEGLSILRNDREVYYGFIPHTSPSLHGDESRRNVSRFIGCEISFSADLDQEFAVKNIKRGAVPVRELKKKIVEILRPTFLTKYDIIKNRWNEIDREKEENTNAENEGLNISNTHGITNKILKDNKDALLKKDKAGKEENNTIIVNKVKPGAKGKELEKIIEGLKENGITIDEREFVGDAFIDIEHGNALKTMFYNTNSTFYRAYKEILDEIKSKNESIASDYKVLIDLIFVAYMLAESQIDPEEEFDGESFVEELKSNWAISLSKILKRWKN